MNRLFWHIFGRYSTCGTLGGSVLGPAYAVIYLVLWAVVRGAMGEVGPSGIEGIRDVLLAVLGTFYVLIVASVWGMAFGLPVGITAGLVGGFLNGLLAVGYYHRLVPARSVISYRTMAGAVSAISNAFVAACMLPWLGSAYRFIGPLRGEHLLSSVVLPALLAGWAGWAARGRLATWYGCDADRGIGSAP